MPLSKVAVGMAMEAEDLQVVASLREADLAEVDLAEVELPVITNL
jgi:hypothetical protein